MTLNVLVDKINRNGQVTRRDLLANIPIEHRSYVEQLYLILGDTTTVAYLAAVTMCYPGQEKEAYQAMLDTLRNMTQLPDADFARTFYDNQRQAFHRRNRSGVRHNPQLIRDSLDDDSEPSINTIFGFPTSGVRAVGGLSTVRFNAIVAQNLGNLLTNIYNGSNGN